MLAIGACETAIIATSWFSRWTTKPLKPSAIAEHAGQPAVYSGPNMKWYIRSCERPLNRSANEALPSSVSKRKSFSRGTQGSSCRFRASSSLRRVSSFSASSNSSLAASHSSRVPVLWFVISLLLSLHRGRETGDRGRCDGRVDGFIVAQMGAHTTRGIAIGDDARKTQARYPQLTLRRIAVRRRLVPILRRTDRSTPLAVVRPRPDPRHHGRH